MKKVCLLLSFLYLPSVLYSCGWGPTYNQFSLFFHPVSQEDRMYPFKYVADEFLYNFNGKNYYFEHVYSPKDYGWNNQEWKKVLNTQASVDDINDFVYHYPYKHLKSLYYHLERGETLSIPDSMKRNGLTAYFEKQKDFETLGYLMYAKQCEEEDNKRKSIDKWEYENYTNRRADEQTFKLITNGTKLYNAAKSDWIKKRYAFQFIRLAHYFKEYKKADELYTQFVEPLKASNMLADYWLWGLRGGILRRLNRKEEAQIWFAKTVVRSPDKYLQAYNDFRHNEISAEQALPYCKNYMDSADVLFVSSLAVGKARIAYLEQLYTIQPTSKMIPLLMSRELAKLEMTYLPGKIISEGFGDWNERSYKSKGVSSSQEGLATLLNLTKRMIKERKRNDIKFLKNYAAYLSIADGTYDKKFELLTTPKAFQTKSHTQSDLLAWVVKFKEGDKINETQLFDFLKNLDGLDNSSQSVQSAKYHFLKYFVAPYFEKTKQPIRKAYALLRADVEEGFYSNYEKDMEHDQVIYTRDELSHYLAYILSFEKLDEILTLEKNKNSNDPFVNYATSNFSKSFGMQSLVNILTRKHVRNMNWEEAERYYTMGKSEERKYDDPIAFRTKEECRISYYNDKLNESRIYTTSQILQLAQQLKSKTRKNKGEDLYKYGMLLYNLSYYGVLENLAVYDHRNYGVPAYTGLKDSLTYESNFYPIPRFQGMKQIMELENYFNLSQAKPYFERAYEKLKTPEARAECAFMLALCWQKTGDAQVASSKNYVHTSIRNPYFKIFKNEFSQTATYNKAFSTCGYLRLFAGQ